MAYAGARFTGDLLRALHGEKGVVTPTFVKSPLFADQGIDFFSSNVELGVRISLLSSLIPLLMFYFLGQRCREDPPHWQHLTRGAKTRRRLLARAQEEH